MSSLAPRFLVCVEPVALRCVDGFFFCVEAVAGVALVAGSSLAGVGGCETLSLSFGPLPPGVGGGGEPAVPFNGGLEVLSLRSTISGLM